MNLTKTVAHLVMIYMLSACGYLYSNHYDYDAPLSLSQQETEIYLQEPFTRVIARCYASAEYAANACAEEFERKGYVRFSNLPYKTARYDFLTKDTYPTRRWRENELTPRW